MLVPSEEEVSGRSARAAPAPVRTSVSAAAVDGLPTGLASSCPDQRLVSLSRVVIVGSRGEQLPHAGDYLAPVALDRRHPVFVGHSSGGVGKVKATEPE